MHAKLSIDEIEVFEDVLKHVTPLVPGDAFTLNSIGRAKNIVYLKRAEIRMNKRLLRKGQVIIPRNEPTTT